MTYKELGENIDCMTEEQKNMDVTIYDGQTDELVQVVSLEFTEEADILDKNHPYLIIN